MTQLRRDSCCTTSCCTRGVAVAVSAMSGTLGYLQTSVEYQMSLTRHRYTQQEERQLLLQLRETITRGQKSPLLEHAQATEVWPEVVTCDCT
jgi:hypothetical protein